MANLNFEFYYMFLMVNLYNDVIKRRIKKELNNSEGKITTKDLEVDHCQEVN
jgi:hypothetical protein